MLRLSHHTTKALANTVSSTLKIYTESDHFLTSPLSLFSQATIISVSRALLFLRNHSSLQILSTWGQGLGVCISSMFPGDVGVASSLGHMEKHPSSNESPCFHSCPLSPQ